MEVIDGGLERPDVAEADVTDTSYTVTGLLASNVTLCEHSLEMQWARHSFDGGDGQRVQSQRGTRSSGVGEPLFFETNPLT